MPFDPTPMQTGPEFRVDVVTTDSRFMQGAVPLAGGGFVVVWQRHEPWKPGDGRHSTKHDVYAQRYDADGGPAGAEFRIHDRPEGTQRSPSVAALADGGFLVAWSSYDPAQPDGHGSGFFARRYAANGTALGEGFRVHDSPTGGSAVAAFADGGFLIAWPSDDPAAASGPVVHARRYGPDGVPTDAEFRVGDAPDASLLGVQVTVLADGGFVVLCHTSDRSVPGNHGLLARRYAADGTPVGDGFPVHTAPAGDQLFAKVVALPDGGFVIVWQESAEASRFPQHDTYDVFARRYAADGTPLGEGFRVHDAVGDGELLQGAAALADGGFVAVWMIFDPAGSGRYIHYARRFAANGVPEGDEFRVHFVHPDDDWTGWAGWAAVAAGAPSQVEGDAGVTEFTFDVTLNKAFSSAQDVAWRVEGSGDRAADAADFEGGVLPSGTLTFAAGETRKTVTVRVAGDAIIEADEAFAVSLLATSEGLVIGAAGHATATVLDDDLPASAPPAHAAMVVRLYDAALDRLPDRGGFEFWVGALQKGEALSSLASGFLASEEFAARFGGASADDDSFVERLYQNVLGRAGEAEGRAFWGDSLDKGCTRAEVLAAFSESAEHVALTEAAVRGEAGVLFA